MNLSRLTNSISDYQDSDFPWINMLTGVNGYENQAATHKRMHTYLCKVAFNYLRKR